MLVTHDILAVDFGHSPFTPPPVLHPVQNFLPQLRPVIRPRLPQVVWVGGGGGWVSPLRADTRPVLPARKEEWALC